MHFDTPTLHLLCGKVASGKSTLATDLATEPGVVVIAEDEWLATLYADQMSSLADYVRFAQKLRQVMGPHIAALLRAGVSVVLDFQANTPEARAWARSIIEETGAGHALHLLEVPDEVCLARLVARNAAGDHPFAVSEAQFREITRHFRPPTDDEGFHVIRRPFVG